MVYSILVCSSTLPLIIWLLRREPPGRSLGLPVAYVFLLLLNHVPGAVAHCFGAAWLTDDVYTALGMRITAVGALCFVAGHCFSRQGKLGSPASTPTDRRFWKFCAWAGLFASYGLFPLHSLPSIGAVIDKAAGIWLLGVILGLRATLRMGSLRFLGWIVVLMISPLLILLQQGFLSFGSIAIIICLAPLTVSTRQAWRVIVGVTLTTVVGLHVFLAYYQNRDNIREQVWGGGGVAARVQSAKRIITDIKLFDPHDETQLNSLDQRLNQNYFVGLSAERLRQGEVEYYHGKSLWEGLEALVPRLFWPDKPVKAGSGRIVIEMTGLESELSETTSWGVGNVMEFYINFGWTGVVVGFLLLGWGIGRLDLLAAQAERTGNVASLFKYFLVGVALIQPLGSIVEIFSSVAACWLAAWVWGKVWGIFGRDDPRRSRTKRFSTGRRSAVNVTD